MRIPCSLCEERLRVVNLGGTAVGTGLAAPRVRLTRGELKLSDAPLDPACGCATCRRHSRGYLHHLMKCKEPLGPRLLSLHNLQHYLDLMREARGAIEAGRYAAFAREKLEAIDRQVELAIIDTNIKGLPLTKVLQILRKCRPRVPVIVVSGDYTVETGSRIMEQGVFYYTYKPLDMSSFKEIIESALKKRAKEQEQERR